MRNRLTRHDGSDGTSTPRFAYGTQEFLDWHNSRRTRRDKHGDFEMEWFYDSKHEMRCDTLKPA